MLPPSPPAPITAAELLTYYSDMRQIDADAAPLRHAAANGTFYHRSVTFNTPMLTMPLSLIATALFYALILRRHKITRRMRRETTAAACLLMPC